MADKHGREIAMGADAYRLLMGIPVVIDESLDAEIVELRHDGVVVGTIRAVVETTEAEVESWRH